MSTSFEIFPTNRYIPKIEDILNSTKNMFDDFLSSHNSTFLYTLSAVQFDNDDNIVSENPPCITDTEQYYTSININNEGFIYIFCNKLSDLDDEIWTDEPIAENAQRLKEKIIKNKEIGYSWQVKRTAGQSAIASLIYGYIAIAIAEETNGFIYSDDGAWEYRTFPILPDDFRKEYLMPEQLEKSKNMEWYNNMINEISKKA